MRSDRLANALGVLAVGLLAMAAMSGGTSASFTATTMNPSNVMGTAMLSLTNDKSAAGQLVNITNLVPGDTVSRTVTISNTGTAPFMYYAVASAPIPTVLWSDASKGLQVSVKRGAAAIYAGALKDLSIPASLTIAAAATDTLTFDFSLPTTADGTFSGLSQTFTITYTASQLPGSVR